jgi:GAF domain-containing protein
MLKDDALIGAIVIYRQKVRPFTDKQIALVQNFAAQAVIAIENARLFDEVQAKTRDLEESLQRQTAMSEVLQTIGSSPGDLAPVFDKMLENATRVCGAEFGSMVLVEDDSLRQAALYNAPAALAAVRTNRVFRPHPQGQITEAIRTRRAVQVADMRATAAYLERSPTAVELVELGGARTVVFVPMLREDKVIGAITIYRQEVRPFADKQIELVSRRGAAHRRQFTRKPAVSLRRDTGKGHAPVRSGVRRAVDIRRPLCRHRLARRPPSLCGLFTRIDGVSWTRHGCLPVSPWRTVGHSQSRSGERGGI